MDFNFLPPTTLERIYDTNNSIISQADDIREINIADSVTTDYQLHFQDTEVDVDVSISVNATKITKQINTVFKNLFKSIREE